MADTTYIVLRNEGEASGWQFITGASHQTAKSAADAIRQCAAQAVTSGGTYVAVPQRSWKPVTVKAETKTILTLEQHD